MPALTSLGIGSGIDLNTMLTQLVALERKPLEQMQAEASKLQTKVSSFGQIQSLVSRIQDAANKLKGTTGSGVWSQSVAKSANDQVVTAVSGSSAATGSYAVSVTSLATAQTIVSGAPYADASELIGEGTLTLEVGAWNADRTAFTAKAGSTSVALAVTATDTIGTLRDKINALGAGVSASLVTDANGTRLALRSTATGAVNGFRITAADADGVNTDATGLSRVAYDPPGGTTGMLFGQAGANAVANVNGVPVNSATNELSGVIDGLTLRLRGNSATPVDVDVSPDREAITEAVKGLASAYSDLAKYIGEQTKYDATSKVGGPLQGDSAVGGVLARLRGVINNTTGASATFARLSDVGLELQRDGTLSVDSAKLDKALGNLEAMEKAFTNSDPLVPANEGFARRFSALATEMLAVDGSLTTRTEGLRKLITQNSEKQSRLEDRVERYQARMVQQFTAMDSNLARLNALNSYVTQQLAALTNSSSS
ncbi:MAG: flagellar filament capping protein FliD [Burkholderiales bacterium]|nr:flagellar filament capping protein FliD [Burkholderiales bacterium]